MNTNLLFWDKVRYSNKKIHRFQRFFRKYQIVDVKVLKLFYKVLYYFAAKKNHIEILLNTKIDGGLYIGHPYCITVNPKAVIGYNCNLHKGVTIGQENRGDREGVPTTGNCVWIGINSTVVGK